MRVTSHNPSDTKRFARRVANIILRSKHRTHAAVVALSGDLGAGKTTFAQGFAKALGVKGRIASPTFVIFRSYKLLTTNYKLLYHVDAYRLHGAKELLALGFKKVFADSKNIVLIEWADNVRKVLPKDAFWIHLSHGRREGERKVIVL